MKWFLVLNFVFVTNVFAEDEISISDCEACQIYKPDLEAYSKYYPVYTDSSTGNPTVKPNHITFIERMNPHLPIAYLPLTVPPRIKVGFKDHRLIIFQSEDIPFENVPYYVQGENGPEPFIVRGKKLIIHLDKYVSSDPINLNACINNTFTTGMVPCRDVKSLWALVGEDKKIFVSNNGLGGHLQQVFDYFMASIYEQEIAAGAETTRDGRSQYKSTTGHSTLFVKRDENIPAEQVKPGEGWRPFARGIEKINENSYLISEDYYNSTRLITFDHTNKTYKDEPGSNRVDTKTSKSTPSRNDEQPNINLLKKE